MPQRHENPGDVNAEQSTVRRDLRLRLALAQDRPPGSASLRHRPGSTSELELAAEQETQWRYDPSSTLRRGPGCYAFQVDGTNFSDVIVFAATR